MVPKVPERHVGESSFGALIRYVSEAKKVRSPSGGEPHIAFSPSVLARTPETAAIEMQALAMQARSNADPVYHFVLAWESGACPPWPEMAAAGWQVLDLIGLGDHLSIVAAHHNTQHVHLHCSSCLIHPRSIKPASTWQDWPRLHYACRVVELEFGWPHDRGCYEVAEIDGRPVIVPTIQVDSISKRSRGAIETEIWNGNSFQKAVQGLSSAVACLLMHEGASWAKFHELLARTGIGLRPCDGGGLLFALFAPDDPRHQAKASLLGKAAAWPALIRRLGDFESSTVKLGASIDFRQPLDPEVEPLWSQWVLERGNARLSQAMARYRRAGPLLADPSFRTWLETKARTGDSASIRALTRLTALAISYDEDDIELPNIRPTRLHIDGAVPKLVAIEGIGHQRHSDGSIEYRLPGHLGFIDYGDRLVIYDASGPALSQAIEVARNKWPSGIEILGEPSFIHRATQIALSAGISVKITPMSDDPAQGARLSEIERRFATSMIDLAKLLPKYGFMAAHDGIPEFGLPFSRRMTDGDLSTIFAQRTIIGTWHWVQWSPDAEFGIRKAAGDAVQFLTHFRCARNKTEALEKLDEEITNLQADAIRQSIAIRRDDIRHDHTSARQQWTSADPSRLHGYLKDMGITDETKAWAGDVCRCDHRGYAVFQRRDEHGRPSGYERYHHIRQNRLAAGGIRNGIIAMGETQSSARIVIFDNAVDALQSAQAEHLPAATLYISTGGDGDSKSLRHLLASHTSAIIQIVNNPWLATRLEDDGLLVQRIPDTAAEPRAPAIATKVVEVIADHSLEAVEADLITENTESSVILDDALFYAELDGEDEAVNDQWHGEALVNLNETPFDPEDYPSP